MLLSLLVIIPFLSGIFSFFSFRFQKNIPRWIALTGMGLTLLTVIRIWFFEDYYTYQIQSYTHLSYQLILPWISSFGIQFHIAVDGFSIVMLFLTLFLGIIAILCSWNEIKKNEGFFYLNIMLVLMGTIGVFIAFDLFLFFFFWEIILIPMYFLISLWNQKKEDKKKCINIANKFFIYTQISGLIMLASILLLVLNYYINNKILTFNYDLLLIQPVDKSIEYIIMLGFFLAFIIKMPIVPFHGWLADFHERSPYCGAVDIIGALLKTAPYGLLRYNKMLFPNATEQFAPIAIFLGFLSMFYGAWVAFSQVNIKRLIAYSSISHMGLMLIAIYGGNEISFQGLIIQILSNSISTSALFILSGQIYKYLKTQDISEMGGLWTNIYWIPGFSLFFALSNLGIPGTGNFIGEFLILFGIFKEHPLVSIISTIGIIFSSIYSLNMIQKIYYGLSKHDFPKFFLNIKEFWISIVLIFALIFLGLIPQKILNISFESIHFIYNFSKRIQ
ncbi:NADH-quinone oxidoreductase subunit M [Buchnera aphidicola]|uniref:NADH-quinone oxidoreductase subunit M n=1 Tax=Buchnera aphidicola subsp. Schizaphis graminum (strain Sg) TaxID=198804 RepID=NUOM_BUCAP|nr:NADH-quinone oxidoreductase subunit M [Buchnera aphidicola]Q8K9X6.1 RecName: Full=NADH-quinone oxidoreductase subunit M; AltName: Full=NADH dehydrogenase I subunit M; AltName: Full=NDH-1 subunit M [Buchnera aphidicola str. Sg (Schizaphis graminum)]AAM67726.1 NADH dehydrogenase I chain M [Buchnera aphidicola str. Sg (Schizaphis graminum)]AWI49778.1 NADH-quinone oxidoreductase subunit M [Buchnera aphidicola (Schizaphis graminum)]